MTTRTFTDYNLHRLEGLAVQLQFEGWKVLRPVYVNWRCAFAIRMQRP